MNKRLQAAWLKLSAYCAAEERATNDLRNKLRRNHFSEEEIQLLLEKLIAENFLNEERYCRSFCRGYFRMRKWGRRKLIQSLKSKGYSSQIIFLGLEEISEEEYIETLDTLIFAKRKEKRSVNPLIKQKAAVYRYVLYKGYEPEIALKRIEYAYSLDNKG